MREQCESDYRRLAEEWQRKAEAAVHRRAQAEQAQARARAEQEAAEAERAEHARLEAMTPERRLVYRLECELERVKAANIVEASGDLRRELNRTVQQVAGWNAVDKAALLVVARALFAHWNVNPKKGKARELLKVLKS